MRKIILIFLMLLLVSGTCFAEKQEWVNKTFDFTKVKKVYIYNPSVAGYFKNGIVENEILDIFNKTVKLPNTKILNTGMVATLIEKDTGIDLLELNRTNPVEAGKTFLENVPKHVDLIIFSQVGIHGGTIPLASTPVRWNVIDAKTGKTVFFRIDDRDRIKLENTTPNDLYKRITSSFFSDLNDKIKG